MCATAIFLKCSNVGSSHQGSVINTRWRLLTLRKNLGEHTWTVLAIGAVEVIYCCVICPQSRMWLLFCSGFNQKVMGSDSSGKMSQDFVSAGFWLLWGPGRGLEGGRREKPGYFSFLLSHESCWASHISSMAGPARQAGLVLTSSRWSLPLGSRSAATFLCPVAQESKEFVTPRMAQLGGQTGLHSGHDISNSCRKSLPFHMLRWFLCPSEALTAATVRGGNASAPLLLSPSSADPYPAVPWAFPPQLDLIFLPPKKRSKTWPNWG